MISKLLSIVSVLLFTGLIGAVGYLTWREWMDDPPILSTPTPTPTATSRPTATATVTLTPSPTHSGDSFVSPTSTLTPMPPLTPFLTPSPTLMLTPTLPSPTLSPTLTPAPIYGIVLPSNLNVRRGPSLNYGIIGGLFRGEQVIVLRQALAGNWLQIELADNKIGWVAAAQIQANLSQVPRVSVGPTPPPPEPITPDEDLKSLDIGEINIEGSGLSGTLPPYQEQWYTFFEEDVETVIIFIFKPNVNFYDDNFLAFNVEFFLHDHHQIPDWSPSGGWDALRHIGAGSLPPSDRDGDLSTGELVWRGGPLVRETRYYLRLVNRSAQPIEYCLVPRDVREWVCVGN